MTVDPNLLELAAARTDLNHLLALIADSEPEALARFTRSLKKKRRESPPIDSDFYDIAATFSAAEKHIRQTLRAFMETEIRPVINEYWEAGTFPRHLIPAVGEAIHTALGAVPYTFPSANPLAIGLVKMELGRVDPSIATFFGVHWGLCMGSIYLFGSESQKKRWLPPLHRFEKIGSWALTEPLAGSDAARGLQATARREGNTWILNGQKKWSGNATFADVNVIWARDLADDQVKGFLVELGTAGYNVEKLPGKIAKRAVENVLITLEDCRVGESNRLPGVRSFGDVARQLASARATVAWEAVGVATGAYELALQYARERHQFGQPIAGFQLVQEKLVRMLGNVTAMQTMMLRLAHLERDEGSISHERASLAKMWVCEKMRETVAIGRGLFGGNGILLEHDIARLFADAEAIYSYEGTHEMNLLIVGRAITGESAFV